LFIASGLGRVASTAAFFENRSVRLSGGFRLYASIILISVPQEAPGSAPRRILVQWRRIPFSMASDARGL